MGGRMISRCFMLIFLLLAGPVLGHPIFQNPAWIEYTEHEITLTAHVSVTEICTVAGIPIDNSGTVERALVEEAAEKHGGYFLSHFTVSADGQELKPEIKRIKPPVSWDAEITATDAGSAGSVLEGSARDRPDRIHFVFEVRFPCAAPPQRIQLRQNMMTEFTYTPGTRFNFSYMVRFAKAGDPPLDFALLAADSVYDYATVFHQGGGAGSGESTQTGWKRFKEFFHHGVHHVLTGYDHLLFASALVLALRSFWEVFKIIGIFTIAHSITITLAAYNLLRLPDWFPVEPIIAGSIVFVAVENLIFPSHGSSRSRMVITFLFGLVHGMGLAQAFVENLQGFSSGVIALVVLAFCLGVEAGHLMIVAPLSGIMTAGRTQWGGLFSAAALRYGSILIALGGTYYFLNAIHALPENWGPDTLFHAAGL